MQPFTFIGRQGIRFFDHLGKFSILIFQIIKSLGDISTYYKLTVEQMVRIGIRSIPIVAVTSAFSGMVTSVQSAYQMAGYIPEYLVGSVVGESMFLELAPVLTALVLTGRVGANIAAELGTMRITEQIDALETLAFNPVSYLIIPRVIAGIVMLPVLTIFSNVIGITGGWAVAASSLNVTTHDFFRGLKLFFIPWDVIYGLIKAAVFGATITLIACYQGFNTKGGAEGVGAATTNTVVASCILILMLDYFLSVILL